ncbi:MAG TPA: FecR family protein [Blastocatellia bacterium]|nr:FecR family protein [Blastocatellia bacterium]
MILPVGSISRRRLICWAQILFFFAASIQWIGGTARAQSISQVDAHIASVKGRALRHNNQRSYILARGYALVPGDEIDTRGGGRVVIELTDGSLVVIQPNSRIVINDYRAAASLRDLFRIVIGRVRVKIKHLGGKPNPYRVNSPTASILVRGTEFDVAVESSGDTRVVVYQGLVEVESLSDPRRRVLLAPGRGALVRPNEDIRFFMPGPGSEISERGNISGGGNNGGAGFTDMSADPAVSSGSGIRTQLSNDYERYISSIVEPGQSSPLVRFTAFPESHFDTFDNPSYATEFTAIEGRFWLIPSFSRVQGRDAGLSLLGADPLSPFDSGYLAQGDFFVPLERARMVIGGAMSVSSSRLQSLTETRVIGPPIPFFPEGVPGVRHAASSTETASITGSLMAARRFGEEGRASVGIGVDWVSGDGTLSGLTTLTNDARLKATEELEAASNINRLRFQLGMTYEFDGGHKLGLLYRHGLANAEDRDRSRLFNGLPLSLDSTRQDGRSSEIGFRLRGPVTRRLFYGLEGSLLRVGSDEQIRRAVIVDSTAHASVTRVSAGFGLGLALRPTTVVSADFAFGLSLVRERNYEDSTGNSLEDERRRIRFASAHLGLQTDIWRQSFISVSALAIRQANTSDLNLYPDRFGRRLTSFGLDEPDGRARHSTSIAFSDFGVGWRFNSNWLVQYIFSVNRDLGPSRHVLLMRYTFKHEK